MDATGLEVTNAWLSVIAVASAVQTALFIGATVALFVIYRRTATVLHNLEERHLAPLAARADRVIDDLQDVTARVRRVDDVVREKVQHFDKAVWTLATRAWPVIGIARAIGAGLKTVARRSAGTQGNGSVHVADFERRRKHV